jgi:hypothetical protein
MSQPAIRTTTTNPPKAKTLPPAGLRPPAPSWARIIAWLLLVLCLGLCIARDPLLAWAIAQPALNVPLPGAPSGSLDNGPQGFDRVAATAGLLVRAVVLPPGMLVVQGSALLGLSVIGLELSCAALVLVWQRLIMGRQQRLVLLIRLPYRPTARTTETSSDLFRALHQHLPATNIWSGQAPWFTLTLSARPDEPVALGIVLSGGTNAQRTSRAAAVRKTIQGLAPDAVIEEQADALANALTPGCTLATTNWHPALPAIYPFRLHDDQASGDLMRALAAALHPRQGVAFTELQLALRPRRDDAHLAKGWRARAMGRLLRLMGKQEYALTPDARALEAKLAGPVYDATLRAVAIATDQAQLAQAYAELDELSAVLGQYAARSGSKLQRWVRGSTRRVQVTAPPAWASKGRGALLTATAGLSVGGLSWFLAGMLPLPPALVPWLSVPALVRTTLPALADLTVAFASSLTVVALLHQLTGAHTARELRAIAARPLRATPLPSLLWLPAWRGPTILSASELAGLWHLPTPAQGRLVRWLPCLYLPPPPHAFASEPPTLVDGVPRPARLVIGYGRHGDGEEAPVGIPLRDARQGLAFTAPPGVGKTQLASNLADQLRPCGYTLIDGKGDDAGNLVETVRRLIPLEDEPRLVVLDLLDSAWPVGLNPLAGVDLHDSAGVDQVLGQIEAIFARLDPETWARAPRMKNYLRKATLLVLAGEPQPTIAHVKQALLDGRYREQLLPGCRNVEVRDFWVNEFPQMGEQQRTSRDALVSRFDMLLDSELTRHLFNQITPAFSFRDAIAERLIVLAPLPHRTLGGLAGPVGMLLFQSLMRAAFSRPGSDLTRPEYGFIGDEFQVLVENCDTKDVRDALTQVRSFGIITIIANQLHRQLGDLADYALTAIANRVLLRTQEPDATLYARHYAESGISAADISGQEPREHQYAWFGVHGQLTRLFSMRPLPWRQPIDLVVPSHRGPSWQEQRPSDSTTPAFDKAIVALMYGEHEHLDAVAQALAAADDKHWALLLTRWDAIRAYQRQYILAHPGCIPETAERQRWLSRLRAARPRVLAMAEYARIRQAVQPGTATTTQRGTQQPVAQPGPTTHSDTDPKATQQPHFPEIDQRQPQRLDRVEPNDWNGGTNGGETHAHVP